MEKFQKNNLKKIIELLNSSANNIIVLGAGMSVESGIPTFRGKNGLWTKYGVPKMDSYKKFYVTSILVTEIQRNTTGTT